MTTTMDTNARDTTISRFAVSRDQDITTIILPAIA